MLWISCSRFHALFPTRLVKAPEGLEAVLATGKVEAEERRILMLAGPLSKYSKYSGCWKVRFPNILNIPDAGRSAFQTFQISSVLTECYFPDLTRVTTGEEVHRHLREKATR